MGSTRYLAPGAPNGAAALRRQRTSTPSFDEGQHHQHDLICATPKDCVASRPMFLPEANGEARRMDLPDETVRELLTLVGVALAHDELGDALDEVCRVAAGVVPNADGASLTTFSATGPQAAAASSKWSLDLDEMQYGEHEGPCLDAGRTGVLFRVRDIGAEPRWPSYMPRARAAGALSMVSVPMTVEAKTIGALNVYSRKVDAFGAEDVSLAEVIAGHASLATQVAMALQSHRDLAGQLREAMASRATIEQAKGIVMSAAGCGPDEAFDRLVQQSSHENRKLREVAEHLVRQQRR